MKRIASFGNLEIITALIGAGADVNAVNNKGLTALLVLLSSVAETGLMREL